jgi:endonuclease/exonuclease/phosphatase family metal-dependent hydrolase
VTELAILSWNLFHGRDAPPDPAIRRTAWQLSGRPLDNGVHLQQNRSLEREFVDLIAGAAWSVCLLQEAPPAWGGALSSGSGAQLFRSLTSRNQLAPITRLIARWRPDLIGSWEGGSNMTLVRPPWQIVQGSARTLLLNPLSERGTSERRRMSLVRLRPIGGGERDHVCVANLHAAATRRTAERQVRRAAETAVRWAGGAPLVFGGDFNLRPRSSSVFAALERDFGLTGHTAPDEIDHLLNRGLETISHPAQWAAERRELEIPWKSGSRRITLSDHSPIEATFDVSPMR